MGLQGDKHHPAPADLIAIGVRGSRRGRPRSSRADRAIAAATIDLVATDGLSGLKMERVAQRAGVSKGTIYRRWATKEELVAGALAELTENFPVPDSGEVYADLVTALRYQFGLLTAGLGRVIASLLSEAAFNPIFAAALQEPTRRRRDLLAGILERAAERGQVRADLDLDHAVNLLWGPIYYRFLVSVIDGEAIQPDYVEAVVAEMLPLFARAGS